MEKSSFINKLNEAVTKNLSITLSEEQNERLFSLAEHLVEVNNVMNLTAITNEDGIILRHFVDSMLICEYITPNSRLIDEGGGAGFPTLPLAIIRPDIMITALDSTEKRIRYVQETADILGLTNVKAVTARAENFAKLPKNREKFDHATARAVASMPMLAELTIPFIKVGGSLVAMKAKGAHEEFEASRSAIRQLAGSKSLEGAQMIEKNLVGRINEALVEENRTVIIVPKLSATPKQFPRKFAQIKKSPL